VVKGVWPGIAVDDRVILWGGGLWSWLDPLTAIRAVGEVAAQQPTVRLIFPGAKHPNTEMTNIHTLYPAAQALAKELGLLNKVVFFGEWVAYDEWPSLLLECDLALTLHFETLETRLAFRSRVLDYIWAGVPVVAGQGDETANLIERFGLGRRVPCGDATAVASAIHQLLDEAAAIPARQWEAARQALRWEVVAAPLVAFCLNPHPAADRENSLAMAPYGPNIWSQVYAEWLWWQQLVLRYGQSRLLQATGRIYARARRLWRERNTK
jgi:glycosyltransferase involved in cell wall biosynthesis